MSLEYKIGNGNYQNYTTPFHINQTVVVTARARASNSYGSNIIESGAEECVYKQSPYLEFLDIGIYEYDRYGAILKCKIDYDGYTVCNVGIAYANNVLSPTPAQNHVDCIVLNYNCLADREIYYDTNQLFFRFYIETDSPATEANRHYSDLYVLRYINDEPVITHY